MFKMRKEQKDAFREEALLDFQRQMRGHLERFSPPHLQLLDDRQVDVVIQLGLQRAEPRGFTSARSIRYWIETMFMLGSRFDEDPLLPWVGASLANTSLTGQDVRIDDLCVRAWDHSSRVLDDYGRDAPSSGRFLAALRRIGDTPNEPLAPSDLPAFVERTTAWVRDLFPNRCACAGSAAVRSAIEHATEQATRYGVATERGALVLVAMIFLLGSRFDTDPLVPWAGAILRDPLPTSTPPQRAQRLFDSAAACLDLWWT